MANIARLAFRPNSILRIDFDEMFSDVITKLPTLSGKIMRALVDRPLSVSEAAKVINAGKGGKIGEALEQLEEEGISESFLETLTEFHEEQKSRYQDLKEQLEETLSKCCSWVSQLEEVE